MHFHLPFQIVIAFISWILFKRRNVSQNVLSADIAANAGGSSGPGEPATPAYDELSLSLQQVISRRDRKNFLDKYYVIDKEDSTPKVRGILFVLNLLAQILKVPKKLYLGHGAFGSVFIAHSKPIGPFRVESEKYAIKKIEVRKAGREANFHNNFTISTRFVVRVLDFWYETTPRRCFRPSTVFLYIKMELCGENLREGIRRLRKSFEEAPSSKVAGRQLAVFILHIFQELLMACFVLHKETRISIVDLKPDNVLFGMRGIKLCDFGLMTFMDRTGVGENRTEPAGGTALYQPCKHVIKSYAGKLDKHAMASILDMYAVGLILLEMFYSMNSRKELEETFGNLKKKRELPKRGMEDEWPEVCKVILNLTQNELHKIYSAQKAIFEFNKLWENDVFRYIHFPDSRIIIKDGTPFLQESVNMWKVFLKQS
jgi:serine/threonine protein kinase